MSNVSLVMTLLGPDRPGLVESIADVVRAHDGNWLESRMSHLAGQFAGILRVEVPEERADALTQALTQLDDQGLQLIVNTDSGVASSATEPTGCVQLELVGQDRPGIVREITGVLARHGVNVEDLNTQRVAAPNSGQQLFQATVQMQLPTAEANSQLRAELEKIATDLMVDITLDSPQ